MPRKKNQASAAPGPETPIDLESVARESFKLAARHYHEAAERHEEIDRRYVAVREAIDLRDRLASPLLTRLYELQTAAAEAAANASETLCESIQILCPAESMTRLNSAGQDWVNRAAVWRGRLYASSTGDVGDGGGPLLLIVDMDQVRTVED